MNIQNMFPFNGDVILVIRVVVSVALLVAGQCGAPFYVHYTE